MSYIVLLTLHVGTAILTFFVIGATFYALVTKRTSWYSTCAKVLAVVAAFEVVSGYALAAVAPHLSLLSLNIHILEYVCLCAIVEALIYIRAYVLS